MDGLKKIPATVVRLHNSKKSCWLVIHGKVYDITKFLDEHPGGEKVLLHASRSGDASGSFEDVGHSSTARKMMTNDLIGKLEGYDRSKAPRARKGSSGRALRNPSYAISDYLLPLFLLFLAVVSWLVPDDANTTTV
ncbi:hypothetical protein Taro_006244 [Colocasia esculenta]|uniref:Cytochrome b5 heme-binding domain-containing protein n=1 Tax=Colocasia esculenta TaxID=4460 RepID=A0A843TRY6_COLES|nr:hypothetical protein [Colocasia esculenta]